MKLKLLFFGITSDLMGVRQLEIALEGLASVAYLKRVLEEKYPQLKECNSYAFAVNEAYALDSLLLKENDVVALIPPVSGG
ncbi:putative molybdopterin-synthase small subunit [Polaribacter irgensii 23-P]|uniref:Molybdopterin synthase sulfur carrier subunit n=1 Tax=Polaribacter irgensii 23-P TaxID=313594 RepID=A4BX00_9FLAO|nr:MoaD/ThiS family protein [Polaribacter irgensii]EAR13491.1 putative molybdopterin-synthase small subunit [Polaribacter irgensii 23-P]